MRRIVLAIVTLIGIAGSASADSRYTPPQRTYTPPQRSYTPPPPKRNNNQYYDDTRSRYGQERQQKWNRDHEHPNR